MLNPYDDRCDYGNELKPPYTYKLDFAIGTTYSLNFDALIGACFSLCSGIGTDDINNYNETNKDTLVLSMLDKINKNVAIFCEAGKIQKPSRISKLHIKLEDSIFQIKEQDGIFHPKTWIIRYKNNIGNIKYRFIVLSRNISFDNSWDVLCSFDGELTENKNNNKELIDFIKYLKDNITDNAKKDKMDIIINELSKVEFEHNGYSEMQVIPFGIENYRTQNIDMYNSSKMGRNTKIFIMSPFISDSVIKQFNSNLPYLSTDNYLITRYSELHNISSKDTKNLNVYVMNENLVELDENGLYSNDIHAKIYFTQNEKDKNLYIGSLNATNHAFYNNIELIVRLKCYDNYNTSNVASSIINPKKNSGTPAFVKIDNIDQYKDQINADEKKIDDQINSIINKISREKIKATVIKNEKNYSLKVYFELTDFPLEVKVSPYLSQQWKNIDKELLFDNLDLADISMFYLIKVEKKEFVIKIETKGLPDRSAYLNKLTIKTKEDFEDYLQYMLDDSGISTIMNDIIYQKKLVQYGNPNNKTISIIKSNNLYEELLKKSYENRNIIKEINKTIESLNDKIVDKEMKTLFKAFSEALK